MTAPQILYNATEHGEKDLTEHRCKCAMKAACHELWQSFHLGSDAEFELWWRFNMEVY